VVSLINEQKEKQSNLHKDEYTEVEAVR